MSISSEIHSFILATLLVGYLCFNEVCAENLEKIQDIFQFNSVVIFYNDEDYLKKFFKDTKIINYKLNVVDEMIKFDYNTLYIFCMENPPINELLRKQLWIGTCGDNRDLNSLFYFYEENKFMINFYYIHRYIETYKWEKFYEFDFTE